uniref:Regulator of nonsense transcripts 1 n=1 Tax=Rhabditophanes sp. KR3021 TaxID=114890 RepID=A0AC35U7P0_9BILA
MDGHGAEIQGLEEEIKALAAVGGINEESKKKNWKKTKAELIPFSSVDDVATNLNKLSTLMIHHQNLYGGKGKSGFTDFQITNDGCKDINQIPCRGNVTFSGFTSEEEIENIGFAPKQKINLYIKTRKTEETPATVCVVRGKIVCSATVESNENFIKMSFDISLNLAATSPQLSLNLLRELVSSTRNISVSLVNLKPQRPPTMKETEELMNNVEKGKLGDFVKRLIIKDCNYLPLPTFKKFPKHVFKSQNICLSEEQIAACQSGLQDIPLSYIQSPPGSGKTILISTIVSSEPNKGYLVIVENNKAVDAVLNAIEKYGSLEIRPLRVYSFNYFLSLDTFSPHSEQTLRMGLIEKYGNRLLSSELKTLTEYYISIDYYETLKKSSRKYQYIKRMYKDSKKMAKRENIVNKILFKYYRPNVILVTANYAKRYIIQKYPFYSVDKVIADEASQMSIASFLEINGTFPEANYLIVGDCNQLAPFKPNHIDDPIVESKLTFSVLNEIMASKFIEGITLDTSYRMHPKICEMISKVFYEDKLQCGITVQDRNLFYNKFPSLHRKSPMAFLALSESHCQRIVNDTFINTTEANIILNLLRAFQEHGISENDIAIVSMYKGQRDYIADHMISQYKVAVHTIDSFQGSEKEIIIVATSKVEGNKEICDNFVGVSSRVNVALSRARNALIIVGNQEFLSLSDIWTKIIGIINESEMVFKAQDYLSAIKPSVPGQFYVDIPKKTPVKKPNTNTRKQKKNILTIEFPIVQNVFPPIHDVQDVFPPVHDVQDVFPPVHDVQDVSQTDTYYIPNVPESNSPDTLSGSFEVLSYSDSNEFVELDYFEQSTSTSSN